LLAWFPKGPFAKRAENKQAKEIPPGSLGLLAWFPWGLLGLRPASQDQASESFFSNNSI